jgi:hypothetical protein
MSDRDPSSLLQRLPGFVGKVVRLTFTDGHVVRAKLISVDMHAPPEIIYDVLQVIERGPSALASVESGTMAAADPTLLAEVSVAE